MQVEVRPAETMQRPVAERLIQLYLYDMASEHPWPLEADGTYAYDLLDRFWQHPYLIYADDELAGFALVIRGCPITHREDCWFIAEFFVLRPYRRQGLGREVIGQLVRLHPGDWLVAVMEANEHALAFWETVLRSHRPATRPAQHDGDLWRVHAFRAG